MIKQNKRSIRNHKAIYLFVEGEADKAYFDTLKAELHMPGLKAFDTKGGSGIKVLEKARSKLKLGNLDEDSEKYLVFDKDALTQGELQGILKRAKEEGFGIGFSNISFEVWLLAHFEKLTKGLLSQKSLEISLSQHLKQSYKKANQKQLEIIISKYEAAINNANVVNKVDFDYQCTTIGTMIEEIRGSSKK